MAAGAMIADVAVNAGDPGSTGSSTARNVTAGHLLDKRVQPVEQTRPVGRRDRRAIDGNALGIRFEVRGAEDAGADHLG